MASSSLQDQGIADPSPPQGAPLDTPEPYPQLNPSPESLWRAHKCGLLRIFQPEPEADLAFHVAASYAYHASDRSRQPASASRESVPTDLASPNLRPIVGHAYLA